MHTGLYYYIYGGYIVGISREINIVGPKYDGYEDYQIYTQALGLIRGQVPTYDWRFMPLNEAWKGLARTASLYFRDYLYFGRRLPDPKLEVPTENVRVGLCCWNTQQIVVNYTSPAVLAGAWRIGVGRVGLLFINIANKVVNFTLSLEPPYLPSEGPFKLLRIDDAKMEIFDVGPATYMLFASLPPGRSLLIEVVSSRLLDEVKNNYMTSKTLYFDSTIVERLSTLGLKLDAQLGQILRAREYYLARAYPQALETALTALLSTARELARFGVLLGDPQAYRDRLSRIEGLLLSGERARALNELLEVLNSSFRPLQLIFKPVLFDEEHTKLATLSEEKAKYYVSQCPPALGCQVDWFLHSGFQRAAKLREFQVEATTQLSKDPRATGWNLVILPLPQEKLTRQEVDLLLKYVREGGGLLILANGLADLDDLTKELGFIILKDTVIVNESRLWDQGSFYITSINRSHPVMEGVVRLIASFPTAIIILDNESVTPLAWTPNDARTIHSGMAGPLIYGVAGTYGNGRFVALADDPFKDVFFVGDLNVKRLALNALAWLTEPSSISNTILVDAVSVAAEELFDGVYVARIGSQVCASIHVVWAYNGAPASDVEVMMAGSWSRTDIAGWACLWLTSEKRGFMWVTVHEASAGMSLRILNAVMAPELVWVKDGEQ